MTGVLDPRIKYSDIFRLPHHVSVKRRGMERINRAAQFAPFAALTGYDELIRESERSTDQPIELDEAQKEELDKRLAYLLRERQPGLFTYFVPDPKKEGGRYLTVSGVPLRWEPLTRTIRLDSGRALTIDSVTEIEITGKRP